MHDHPTIPSFRHSVIVSFCHLLIWSFLTPAIALGQQPREWLTGPALTKRLSQPTLVDWEKRSVREAAMRLAETQHVAVFVDRRVDPTRELTFSGEVSVRAAFEAITQVYNALYAHEQAFPRPAAPIAATQLGPVVFLGPEGVARGLRTLAEVRRDEIRQLPAAEAGPFTSQARLTWGDLATPRQILRDIGAKAGLELQGIDEQVPHDLWPAADLPAMSLIDRLTLVAAQFDLTFRREGAKRLRLVAVTEKDLVIQRSHAGGRNPAELAERWKAACPDAEIRVAGQQIIVRGRLEDHEWPTRGAPSKGDKTKGDKTVAGSTTFYNLTIKNVPMEKVIRELADRLKLKLKMDEKALRKAGVDLDMKVSFVVVQASRDKLLQTALAPAKLKHRINGDVLEVVQDQ
jgi:hypothetical protein